MRDALSRRLTARPLFGWIFLAAALLLVAGFLLLNRLPLSFALVIWPPAGAALMCLCSWSAAIACGQTGQLRSSWIALVSSIVLQLLCMLTWRAWGSELSMTMYIGLLALGFPTGLVLLGLDHVFRPWFPAVEVDVVYPFLLLGLGYLQTFILLPRLFRKRAFASSDAADAAGEERGRS